MTEKNERIHVIEMIENGTITASEGVRLLQALDQDDHVSEPEDYQPAKEVNFESLNTGWEPDSPEDKNESEPLIGDVIAEEFDPQIEKWKRWWMIPLWVGVGITIIGGLLMLWAYQSAGFSFWFGCAWLPFLLGVAVMLVAWGSRSAAWLHLRVKQKPGEWPQTIAFSFPLPLRFAAWFMRIFGRYIPGLNGTGIEFDRLIEIIKQTTTSGTPFYVEVEEGQNGETVQIYIG